MTSPLRLVLVATTMVAVLALVAGFAAEGGSPDRQRTGTSATDARPAAAPGRVVEATVPTAAPIRVRLGDTVKLRVTLEQDDSIVVDAFGFDEPFAAGQPTEVFVTPSAPGTYDLELQDTGGRVGRLLVRPARRASEAPSGRVRPMTPTVIGTDATRSLAGRSSSGQPATGVVPPDDAAPQRHPDA